MKELIQLIDKQGNTESITLAENMDALRMKTWGYEGVREYSCTKIELVKLYVFKEEKKKKKK